MLCFCLVYTSHYKPRASNNDLRPVRTQIARKVERRICRIAVIYAQTLDIESHFCDYYALSEITQLNIVCSYEKVRRKS